MLERARTRLADAAIERFELVEKTASEIDTLPEFAFDAVVAGFSLSEMSTAERGFVLREAAKRLAPDGVLVIADEVLPQRAAARLLYRLLRFPQAALGWLLAGSLSRPLHAPLERDLGCRLRSARREALASREPRAVRRAGGGSDLARGSCRRSRADRVAASALANRARSATRGKPGSFESRPDHGELRPDCAPPDAGAGGASTPGWSSPRRAASTSGAQRPAATSAHIRS